MHAGKAGTLYITGMLSSFFFHNLPYPASPFNQTVYSEKQLKYIKNLLIVLHSRS